MSDISASTMEQPATFPLELLIPKKETQQELFLTNHPEYDGRDIIIAILDTGVDPSLPGLQSTTTGERKLIDCVDCTGAGDVDTSTIKSAVDGIVEGLTGRKLKIPRAWLNPSGKYHLGIKPLHELYSKSLKGIISKEQETEIYVPSHQMATVNAVRAMAKHEEKLGNKSQKVKDKFDREDFASQIEFLNTMKNADDSGPVSDCLVWNDGNEWKACVDTSFDGQLDLCKPMASFRKTGEYSKLTDRDEVIYSFRIDEKDGDWLQIVVANGAHGSHVANIAAANYPEEPRRNGLAPGAKIVSFCIGDKRMNTGATGTAMTRAFNLCAEYGVHVANMSYGGGADIPNEGRIIEELQKVVTRGNVVFTASAGNSGPALGTLGSPGGTTTGVIGVGSYLSPATAEPLHGIFKNVKENLYATSARGPSSDGWLGISLCAPGAALTGVPKFCRKSGEMMNGTSMSSPNVAGSIACLLSGLKANGQPWTSHQIRIALENTAFSVEGLERFAQGQGLVQINSAFDYLRKAGSEFLPSTLTNFSATIAGSKKRGVYLREHYDVNENKEFSIKIEPTFLPYSDTTKQIEFEKHMFLKCDAPWVSIPKTFMVTAGARCFILGVDPTKVQEGTVAYTEVHGFDSNAPHLGPLFRFPVTVIRPNAVGKASKYAIQYNFDAPSGEPARRFVTAPEQARIVEVKVTSLSEVPRDKFYLHKMYVDDEISFRLCENWRVLGPTDYEWTEYLPVKPGRTVELGLTRVFCRGAKPAKIQMDVKFHGMERQDEVALVHGSGSTRVPFSSMYRPQYVKPEIKLNALVLPLKSTSQNIEPLGPNDVFMDEIQVYRMLLSYKLNVTKSTDLRLHLPGISQYCLESPLDCVQMQIFNKTKQFINRSSHTTEGYTHRLEKGDYVIQVQIRHPDPAVLENVRDAPLHVITKIASPIELDACISPVGPITGKTAAGRFNPQKVNPFQRHSVHFGSIPSYKITSVNNGIDSGCFMTGYMTIFADPYLSQIDRAKVIYNFTAYSYRPNKGLSSITLEENTVKKDKKLEMDEAVRDLQISWLTKLTNEEDKNKLYTELIGKYPKHLPLMLTKMRLLLSKKNRSKTELVALNRVIQQILNVSNMNEVLMYLGSRQEFNVDQLSIKKSITERRAAITEALIAKANVLADYYLASSTLEIPTIFKNELPSITKKTGSLSEVDKNNTTKTEEVVSSDTTITALKGSPLINIETSAVEGEEQKADLLTTDKTGQIITNPVTADTSIAVLKSSPLKNIVNSAIKQPKIPLEDADCSDDLKENAAPVDPSTNVPGISDLKKVENLTEVDKSDTKSLDNVSSIIEPESSLKIVGTNAGLSLVPVGGKRKAEAKKMRKAKLRAAQRGITPVETKKTTLKDVDAAYIEALKWVAADDTKMELLSAKHAIIHGHNGRALKYLQKNIAGGRSIGSNTKLAEKAVIEICDRLGWTHISNQLKNQSLVRHMDKYRPFHGTF